MTAQEHYEAAERWLSMASEQSSEHREQLMFYLATAQVHATLAGGWAPR